MLKHMYNYLQEKPLVGIISGFATLGLRVQTLFTDDHILKIVSGVGTWAGATLAVFTLGIRIYASFKRKSQ
ncbi:hypothetical protein J3L18_05310 [Mucilaginibacter gossypii]|uniref:hypothetical protein n=1 Tax=Mucilaginibacter gossypii TaxID=551996 RepID=UPI00101A1C5F|nr:MULTISPECIES: hypothetical protein [Mucilaginibacter]QTE38496.1 hypothetical protein J3L18_05310 [Mucilaginibacter gossypii]